jgi:hypothetical protein
VPGARPRPSAVRAQRGDGAGVPRRRRRRARLRRLRGQRPVPPAAHPPGTEGPRRRPQPHPRHPRRRPQVPSSRLGHRQVRRLPVRHRRVRLDQVRRAVRASLPGGAGHGLGRRRGVLGARRGRRLARRAGDPQESAGFFRTYGCFTRRPHRLLPGVVGRLGGGTRDGVRRVHGAVLLAVQLRRRPRVARRGQEPHQRAGRPLLPGRRGGDAARGRRRGYRPARRPARAQQVRGGPRGAAPPAARVRAAQGGRRALRDDAGGGGGAAGTRTGADHRARAGHRARRAVHAGRGVPPVLERRGERRGAPAGRRRPGRRAHRYLGYGLASAASVIHWRHA